MSRTSIVLAGHHPQLIGDLAGGLALAPAELEGGFGEPCIGRFLAVLPAATVVLGLQARLLLFGVAQHVVVVLQQALLLDLVDHALLPHVTETGDKLLAIAGSILAVFEQHGSAACEAEVEAAALVLVEQRAEVETAAAAAAAAGLTGDRAAEPGTELLADGRTGRATKIRTDDLADDSTNLTAHERVLKLERNGPGKGFPSSAVTVSASARPRQARSYPI